MMLRKPMLVVRKLSIFCLAGIALGVMVVAASAAELPAGTVINKANLDKIMNDTFEGKTIRTLVNKEMEYQIRDWALQIKLRHSKIVKYGPGYLEATEKYAKDVKFDPKTLEVTGWKAGLPFPDISLDDPYAGAKVIWNFYLGASNGRSQLVEFSFLLINDKTGLERRQDWYWLRYYMKGRLDGPGKPAVIGDGSIAFKNLCFATAPFDVRGIGLFTIRWDSPKFEDNWAYIKSVRRSRRLTGSSWMDPIDGLDTLNDELYIWNARPSWYKSFKLLGKQWTLAVANDPRDWVKGAPTIEQEMPGIDFKNWPHWNISLANEWEPREVYVVEAIPPSYHPYSKRVLYVDVHNPIMYRGEGFDKQGNLWRTYEFTWGPTNKEIAPKGVTPPGDYEGTIHTAPHGHNIDFKRRHATLFYGRAPSNFYLPNVTQDDVTLSKMEAAGR